LITIIVVFGVVAATVALTGRRVLKFIRITGISTVGLVIAIIVVLGNTTTAMTRGQLVFVVVTSINTAQTTTNTVTISINIDTGVFAILIKVNIRVSTTTVARGSLDGIIRTKILAVRGTITISIIIRDTTTTHTRSKLVFVIITFFFTRHLCVLVIINIDIAATTHSRGIPFQGVVRACIMTVIDVVVVGILVFLVTTADTRGGFKGIIITFINAVGCAITVSVRVWLMTTTLTTQCLERVGGTLIGTVTSAITVTINRVIDLAGSTGTALITDTDFVALIIIDTRTTVATVRISQTSILGGDINGRGNIKGLGKSNKPATNGADLSQDAPTKKVGIEGCINGQVTRKHQLGRIIGKVLNVKVTQSSVSNLSPVDCITSGDSSRAQCRGLGTLVGVGESQVAVMVGHVDVKKEKGIASHQVKTGSIAAGGNKEGVESFFQIPRFSRALGKCTTNKSK
jgi:hypothetical protein